MAYKVAYDACYCHPLPENHRFPMLKYQLLPEQLLYEGIIQEHQIFCPTKLAPEWAALVHEATYLEKLNKQQLTPLEQRKSGFPHSQLLIHREYMIAGGTLQGCEFALKDGVAFNIAGGTHHAYPDHGEGFCLLNDIAIAAKYLLVKNLAQKILVVDLDVHQGNGTARIFHKDPRVFTWSMHGADNYPIPKEQSDLDLSLATGTTDQLYLKLLDHHLKRLLDSVQPDFVFYQAGVDVLAEDKLGKLALTSWGCAQRDYLVLSVCKQNRIPVMVTMGGGYAPHLSTIINAHAQTYSAGTLIYC